MPRALRLLVATALAVPLLVATGGRAVACSCAAQTAKQTIRGADAIVAGHVVNQIETDPMTTRSTLAVDGVYKGDATAEITLVANVGSGGANTCSVLYPVGATVDPLVLTRHADGTYEVQTCALLTMNAVRAQLGPAKPPPPGADSSPPPFATVPPSIVEPGISWPAVAGGIAVALVLMAWALRRAHRERVVRVSDGVSRLQALARDSVVGDDPLHERDHDDDRHDDHRDHDADHGQP
jgi:hypothetical protein